MAWKPLLSFEEFSAGNYTVGRGYDPGTLLGDRGFGTQAEAPLRQPHPAPARKRRRSRAMPSGTMREVSNRDELIVVDRSRHLNSVGGGARIGFDRFALDAALAVPLTRVGLLNEKPDPALPLLPYQPGLWPWSYR